MDYIIASFCYLPAVLPAYISFLDVWGSAITKLRSSWVSLLILVLVVAALVVIVYYRRSLGVDNKKFK